MPQHTSDKATSGRRPGERRQAARHSLEVQIEVGIGRSLLFHATTNLSRDGAFLQQAIPYKVGTRVKLVIRLPDGGKPIACAGAVANVPDAKSTGMGLKFSDITEKDQRRIDAFAKQIAEEVDVEF
jgi:Tfp pilus assembly protein PilZ